MNGVPSEGTVDLANQAVLDIRSEDAVTFVFVRFEINQYNVRFLSTEPNVVYQTKSFATLGELLSRFFVLSDFRSSFKFAVSTDSSSEFISFVSN